MSIKRKIGSSKSGQTLIEAIAAVGITVIIASSLMALGVATIRSATVSRNRSQAVSYAQEGIEAVRSIRDRSYSELSACIGAGGVVWSVSQSRWNCRASSVVTDIFTRSLTVALSNPPDPGSVSVTVQVAWDDGAGHHDLELDTLLTDWR